MDVKNTFLHGYLHEEIYMKLPSGMPTSSSSNVCRLRRSLYGLKQAPRSTTGIALLLVYVDDIIIIGTDCSLIMKFQQFLHATFHMKDLGQLTYFLGLEVHHWANGIFLNQHKYVQDLIAFAGLEDFSSVDTPMELNVKYRKDERNLLDDPTLYHSLVGSLIYLTTTRPDISYAIHQVSQFMSNPRHFHLAIVCCIVRYLRGSPTRGLFFPRGSSFQLSAYSDADWTGCPDTHCSTTGWCMFLDDALISWKCKKQDRVSKSSTEAEYRAMSTTCFEIIWLHGLLKEIGFS
ncbi:uncharacterized protein LOC111393155 [Olea europaea var. sylvestris]|uniref:uncharacterized protein LOC111393155 n=1 Tax=Olea europaea var. sylvestris TaxID=158386 RepID=UPI000C1D6937|nr:uncharacterized protein LOC111393155 [Olea europaea var. sylvestris]